MEKEGMCGVRENVRLGIAYLLVAASNGEEAAADILEYMAPLDQIRRTIEQVGALRQERDLAAKDLAKYLEENPPYSAFITEAAATWKRESDPCKENLQLEFPFCS